MPLLEVSVVFVNVPTRFAWGSLLDFFCVPSPPVHTEAEARATWMKVRRAEQLVIS